MSRESSSQQGSSRARSIWNSRRGERTNAVTDRRRPGHANEECTSKGGVMVEPVPYVFDRLKRNYAHRSDLILVNAAITSYDGTSSFYCIEETSDALPAWYDQVGSFTLNTILDDWSEKMIPDLRERIKVINVSCLTFESLLTQAVLPVLEPDFYQTSAHLGERCGSWSGLP